ncbi:glycosyltransferase [Paraburkholderia lycopersici]|uniref:Glycosyltransferase involved in cell wall bisynthesis n=1 Tax=Paraburkholderia lycopersici TaxID=416944 RepID=A0A1G6NFG2_9BURK|nr:glycosyltransferase [Paraburkholderia lycopersici]SDC66573.1 Glycosyltransferase involved in cell wall bisynthesis [Paraburkholderia lycopersici]
MKICQISKADSFGGGASRVAEELTLLLRGEGYGAQHWVSWSGKPVDFVVRQPLYGRFERRIRSAHYVLKRLGFPEYLPLELPIVSRKGRVPEFDIAHFHDLSSAISPYTLAHLSRRMPVVWTIHDCSPFTGGCLYPMGCERFMSGCGSCPQSGTWPIDSMIDTTRMGWKIKRRVHREPNLHCITPSQWMADMAMKSGMFERPPLVLPNGIDTALYRNHDKQTIRRELGIAAHGPVVLLSAGHVGDERKGVRYSLGALRTIADLKPFVVVLGAADPAFHEQLAGFEYLAPGYVSDPADLARYYSAADVLLFCSLADNQPLSIIEAMSAGTPLVGFATGGIPEMVVQDETGFLVAQKDEPALAAALRRGVEPARAARWSENGRRHAVEHYSHEALLERHLNLYNSLIEDWYLRHERSHI